MKFLNIFVAAWQLVAKNPPLTAAVFNVLIIAGATVGLHLDTNELATVCGVVAVVFGLLVRAGVIPVAKVSNVKAGLKSTVPDGMSVAAAVPEVPLDVAVKPQDAPPPDAPRLPRIIPLEPDSDSQPHGTAW
jgi:hypothetical protein